MMQQIKKQFLTKNSQKRNTNAQNKLPWIAKQFVFVVSSHFDCKHADVFAMPAHGGNLGWKCPLLCSERPKGRLDGQHSLNHHPICGQTAKVDVSCPAAECSKVNQTISLLTLLVSAGF